MVDVRYRGLPPLLPLRHKAISLHNDHGGPESAFGGGRVDPRKQLMGLHDVMSCHLQTQLFQAAMLGHLHVAEFFCMFAHYPDSEI